MTMLMLHVPFVGADGVGVAGDGALGGGDGSGGGEEGGKQPKASDLVHWLLPSSGPQHSRTTPAASSFQEK